jgi:hypothetical protein
MKYGHQLIKKHGIKIKHAYLYHIQEIKEERYKGEQEIGRKSLKVIENKILRKNKKSKSKFSGKNQD